MEATETPTTPQTNGQTPPPEAPATEAPDTEVGEDTPWWDWEKRLKARQAEDEPEGDEPAAEGAEAATEAEKPEETKALGKGSEAEPLTVDDVPDQYVRVKVDGQEMTLNLRDCVTRGIGTATLQRRLNELATVRKEVDAEREQVVQTEQTLKTFVGRLTSDPAFMRDWMRRYAGNTFREAAEAELYERIRDESLKPEERTAKQLAEERAKLERERQEWEAQQTELRQQHAVHEAQMTLRPMLERAASAAGLEMSQEFVSLMRPKLDRIFGEGRMPTPDEVIGAAKQVAEWRGVRPQPAPQRAAPQPPQTPRQDGRSAPAKPRQRRASGPVDPSDYFARLRQKYGR